MKDTLSLLSQVIKSMQPQQIPSLIPTKTQHSLFPPFFGQSLKKEVHYFCIYNQYQTYFSSGVLLVKNQPGVETTVYLAEVELICVITLKMTMKQNWIIFY